MRVLCLAVLLGSTALAAGSEKDVYFANAGAVTDLCRSVMTPPDAAPDVTRQFDGLCDCMMSGILALNTTEANTPFLAVWAEIARWRTENDPSDVDAVQAKWDAAIYVHYRDMAKGKAELGRYADTAVTLTQICSDGFAASGMAPPDFSAYAAYEGFSRKPD